MRAPGVGEVRLRVDAIGLNRAEVNFRRGTYLEAPRLPAGLGSEAAGEVLETGEGVTGWHPGDQVSVVPVFSQNDYPVYAEEAVVPAAALLARPAGMDAVTGAATWMPYLTVYGMVQEIVRVRPGDHVLLTGASNSIGMAAIQVVRHLGAIPLVTAPGQAQRRALLDAGAEVALAEDETDLVSSIRGATGGRGVELVLDAIGGPGVETLVKSTATGGAVIVHGGLSGQPTPLPAGRYAPVWMRRYTVFEITSDPTALRRGEHFVRAGLAAGAFAPHVDRVFEFEDVAEAHVYLDSPERAPGKPVLRVR